MSTWGHGASRRLVLCCVSEDWSGAGAILEEPEAADPANLKALLIELATLADHRVLSKPVARAVAEQISDGLADRLGVREAGDVISAMIDSSTEGPA